MTHKLGDPGFSIAGYDWVNRQFLGQGSFGVVFKVRNMQTG